MSFAKGFLKDMFKLLYELRARTHSIQNCFAISLRASGRNSLFIVFSVFNCVAHASVVMDRGKTDDEVKEFTLPVAVQAYRHGSAQGHKAKIVSWIVGLGEPTTGDDAAYALSYAFPNSSTLSPLVTSTSITVNNVAHQPHPLSGRPIALLKLFGISPLVVPADNLSELILFNISSDPYRVLRVQLFDLLDNPAAAVALEVLQNPSHIPDVIIVNPNMTAAVATRPLSGAFGDPGSGITMVMTAVARDPEKDKDKNNDGFKPEEVVMATFRVVPLDRMSRLIGITAPVTSMKDFVTLHASESLSKFFVGVNIGADSSNGGGAIAVHVAHLNREPNVPVSVVMEPIVTGSILDINSDVIVATRPMGQSADEKATVAAHCLRTMRTSTGLDYIIVNGGVGDEQTTQRTVFALPIIRASGQLAHAYARPVTSYINNMPFKREFETLPATSADLYTSTSIPARVGGGPLAEPITDMVISGDAVFASTASGKAPGLWQSQAIFGKEGTIISWTPWRRTGGGHARAISSFAHDEHSGTWWFITPEGQARKTEWNATSPLAILIKDTVAKQTPVQHSNDFARGIFPGLCIVASAHGVLMAQTDTIVDGAVVPRVDFAKGYVSDDGTLRLMQGQEGYSWIWMKGGALSSIGTITSSALVGNKDMMWYVLGGDHGISMLTKPNGSGCVPCEYYGGMTPDMSWRFVSVKANGQPVTHIRKLVADGDTLYILTLTGLYKTSINALHTVNSMLTVTPLVNVTDIGGIKNSTLVDVYICGPLAILATSFGLFRSGNGVNFATVSNVQTVQWTRIDLPYSPGPIVNIVPIGSVRHVDDAGYDANMYVLSAAAVSMQARVYRLTISHSGTINDGSVVLFPDEVVQGKRSFFLSVGDYRNGLMTDGDVLFFMRNRDGKQNAYAELMTPDWHSWPLGLNKSNNIVRSAVREIVPQQANEVRKIMHSNGLGAWLIVTDVGLISNE